MNNSPDSKWVNQREIKAKILEVKKLVDRNLQNYLVLQLEDLNGVFVFASQVKENRWGNLHEGQEYTFTIGEDKKGYLNLLDFSF
jgi:hypothetical protein